MKLHPKLKSNSFFIAAETIPVNTNKKELLLISSMISYSYTRFCPRPEYSDLMALKENVENILREWRSITHGECNLEDVAIFHGNDRMVKEVAEANIKKEEVNIHPIMGSDIGDVCTKMNRMAIANNLVVKCVFNGVKITMEMEV